MLPMNRSPFGGPMAGVTGAPALPGMSPLPASVPPALPPRKRTQRVPKGPTLNKGVRSKGGGKPRAAKGKGKK